LKYNEQGCKNGGISKTQVLEMIKKNKEEMNGNKGLNAVMDEVSGLSNV